MAWKNPPKTKWEETDPPTIEDFERIEGNISLIFDMIYPVSSIFMSATHSSPQMVQAAFGGEWEAWGSGRVPVGVDSSDKEKDFDKVEKHGGSKHNVAKHTHGPQNQDQGTSGSYTEKWSFDIRQTGDWSNGPIIRDANGLSYNTYVTGEKGSLDNGSNSMPHQQISRNNAHSHTIPEAGVSSGNCMPYITCFMWKRTKLGGA